MRTVLLVITFIVLLYPAHAQDWKAYYDSAQLSRQAKNTDLALVYYKKAAEALPKDSLPSSTQVQLLNSIGDLLYNGKSLYKEAAEYYNASIAPAKAIFGTNSDRYATIINLLGQLHYRLHEFDAAEKKYMEARQIWRKIFTDSSLQYASSCNMLGILYNDAGQFQKAEASHLEARRIREKLFTRESAAYAQSCNNLAALYWNLGQYGKAEPLAIEAKEIRGRLANVPRSAYAISCINLANIYRDMGKYEDAEKLYIEGNNTRRDFFGNNHLEYASSCNILADLYLFKLEFDKAEALYEVAKTIREKLAGKNSYVYAQSCHNLAALYREKKMWRQAEQLALEAKTIWDADAAGFAADLAICHNNLGDLYLAMGNYGKAEMYYQQARKSWLQQLGSRHPYYADNTLRLARVYRNLDRIDSAHAYYKLAFDLQNQLVEDVFSFTSEREKELYLRNIISSEDEFQSFYYDKMRENHSGMPYDVSLQKRNLILSYAQQVRHAAWESGDSSFRKQFQTWMELKKQLAALYAKGNEAPQHFVKSTLQKTESLEKELNRRSKKFARANKLINWKDIQDRLSKNEATVEFISFVYHDGTRFTDTSIYAALLLRAGMKEPEMISLFEKRELDSLFRFKPLNDESVQAVYTRDLGFNREPNMPISAYNIIWKPLESQLAGVEKIYFAPSGLLHRISFAALPADSNTVLCDKYKLIQLSTTAATTEDAKVIAKKDLALFGGIQYERNPAPVKADETDPWNGKGFRYLVGTEEEVDTIALMARLKKIETDVAKGLRANEELLKEICNDASPAIMHIATHGFFYPPPANKIAGASQKGEQVFAGADNPLMRSGLWLAGAAETFFKKPVDGKEDGVLTAFEVANLYMPKTKLVVLSACHSALGDIHGSEGVYGLQRAFKLAGADYLLMSLWQVPDKESKEFMINFYKNVFDGDAIDKAFSNTQTFMKTKYRHDPYRWAAWILIK